MRAGSVGGAPLCAGHEPTIIGRRQSKVLFAIVSPARTNEHGWAHTPYRLEQRAARRHIMGEGQLVVLQVGAGGAH